MNAVIIGMCLRFIGILLLIWTCQSKPKARGCPAQIQLIREGTKKIPPKSSVLNLRLILKTKEGLVRPKLGSGLGPVGMTFAQGEYPEVG
jgi:hypothetical protein